MDWKSVAEKIYFLQPLLLKESRRQRAETDDREARVRYPRSYYRSMYQSEFRSTNTVQCAIVDRVPGFPASASRATIGMASPLGICESLS